LNILYLDPYCKTPYSKQYLYYEGLYNSLIKKHNVFLYRDLFINYKDIKNIMPFTPDIVIFGLSWFGKHKFFKKIKNLVFPKICFIFKPSIDLIEKLEFCKINQVNLILSSHTQFEEYSKLTSIPAKLFPYGFDPDFFKKRNLNKVYQVGFSGALHQSCYYPSGAFANNNIRQKIYDKIQSISSIDYFWKSSDKFEIGRVHDNLKYAKTINQSKIWIATKAAFGDITPRYFEILGSGTLLLCEENNKHYKNIFINEQNCIEFKSDLSDFLFVFKNLQKNIEKINKISNQGFTDASQFHTWDNRAKELMVIVEGVI